MPHFATANNRFYSLSKKVRVGTQKKNLNRGFTTYKKREHEINLIHVTVSGQNQSYGMDGADNLCKHQLSSVCLVEPF
jgi:hypothetical protein